jgi:glucosamine-6-phosphate deaminase
MTAIELRVCADVQELADAVAARIVEEIEGRPDLVLCLPTGRTPLLVYRKLIEAHQAGHVHFQAATVLIVDEYVGLGGRDPGSFSQYMKENFLEHVDVRPERTHIPDGWAPDPDAEARRYDRVIDRLGGIDLLVLGVGTNGHIGFNEPGSRRHSRTQVVRLAPETIAANERDFPDKSPPPERAITIGLRTIMEARRILLLACGHAKAEPLRHLMEGASAEAWPVAALRDHPATTLFCDPPAGREVIAHEERRRVAAP